MADLVVIVPSRGRPEAALELVRAFNSTCTSNPTLLFAVDESDPTAAQYIEMTYVTARVDVGILRCKSSTMVEALNIAATEHSTGFAVAFMGDDHRPRVVGWDKAYLDALHELGTGIVYGNDLWQGEVLPTQCAMTSDIVGALGYMAPPTLRHMYVDNFWRDLGKAAGCLRYLPNIVIEHVHPCAGKAEMDAGYERVNAPSVYAVDEKAYTDFVVGEMPRAVTAVRQLRGERPPTAGEHEWRLFAEGTVPEYTRPEWYAEREHAPHLEQVGHRDRLMQTASFVAQASFSGGLRSVVDLGAGDGGLLSLLGPSLDAWGYDLMPANLAAAKERRMDVRYGDVVSGDIEWGQIAVCTEMLEHLVDPHGFVRHLADNVQALVCSSPKDERPGTAYEFHTWAWDLDGYRALVQQAGFKVIRQRTVHGFQVILAVKA